jgi:hypothetical protein
MLRTRRLSRSWGNCCPRVVPHFDNHALADRPMFMDDNARRIETELYNIFYSKRLFRQCHGLRCPPPKVVVPKMWLSWNEVFRWRQTLARPSVGRNKKRLSSEQWTRLHVRMDLYVLDGNLTGQKYRDNVLAPRVVPHFDNHALADRPMFMDDNARPHRARIVQHFLLH